MLLVVIQALFFFLPAYISNAVPLFLAKGDWFKFLNVRVDFGYKPDEYSLFGKTKTYRGIIGGTLGGIITIYLQTLFYNFYPDWHFVFLFSYELPSILLLGFLLGIGEGLGDLIKSFFKRRLKIRSSAPAIPLDQSGFLLALLLSYLYYGPGIWHASVIIIVSPLIPLTANIVAYRIGWKDVWW